MGFRSPLFYEGPLVHLPSNLTEGACIGVQTEASREEGLTEGCMFPDGKLRTYLVLSSLHSTGSRTGFERKKIPCPEGKRGKIGKWVARRKELIGAFRQFGTLLSWTV